MARIEPRPSTIKKLFALSGNECAAPQCKNRLIEDDVILGEICHIEAAEENWPRYNRNSDDEYRRSFQNLILLCQTCHKKIDSDENLYPVSLLKSWKEEHERNFKDSSFSISDEKVDKAIREFMKQKSVNTGPGTQINNQANTQYIGTQIGTQSIHNYGKEDEKSYKPKIKGIRKVIPELKAIIDEFREKANPPDKTVIDFRNEMNLGKERPVELVPIKYLKFRKDNGRIRSEVETFEHINGCELVEHTDETQNILRKILKELNPEDNNELKKLIKHKGQIQPAIITCDGFLINGNRRKLVLEELYQENGQDSKYESMRVVILEPNVPEIEIQKIENRYQLQSEGKSEYHGLNRALTLRKNIENGFSLKSQLKDDPTFVDLEGKEFDRALKQVEKDFLKPLECVDRYLETFDKKGLYNTISGGAGDREGRWQAFVDYSAFYYSVLNNPLKRQELGIKENEVGPIENAIFKIIRKRSLDSKELEKSFGKVHAFVRSGNLQKYLKDPIAKKHFINIAKNVVEDIPETEKYDKTGNKYNERDIDELWGKKFRTEIIGELIQARKVVNRQDERDKPLELLEDALKKLNHENLQIDNMGVEHYDKALSLAKQIAQKANEIYEEVDHARFTLNKLTNKKRKTN